MLSRRYTVILLPTRFSVDVLAFGLDEVLHAY